MVSFFFSAPDTVADIEQVANQYLLDKWINKRINEWIDKNQDRKGESKVEGLCKKPQKFLKVFAKKEGIFLKFTTPFPLWVLNIHYLTGIVTSVLKISKNKVCLTSMLCFFPCIIENVGIENCRKWEYSPQTLTRREGKEETERKPVFSRMHRRYWFNPKAMTTEMVLLT